MYQKTKKTLWQLGCRITHNARINRAIQGSVSWQQPAGRFEGASRFVACLSRDGRPAKLQSTISKAADYNPDPPFSFPQVCVF